MTAPRLEDVKPLQLLRDAYGEEIQLEADGRDTAPHRILAEFSVAGAAYAILQTAAMRKNDEVEVYRIVEENGGLNLEIVEDDDEWENLIELYDEMTVSFD